MYQVYSLKVSISPHVIHTLKEVIIHSPHLRSRGYAPTSGERSVLLNPQSSGELTGKVCRTCPSAKFKELVAGATLSLVQLKDEPVRGGRNLSSVICFWSLPILCVYQILPGFEM